jgi:hypothetical protein
MPLIFHAVRVKLTGLRNSVDLSLIGRRHGVSQSRIVCGLCRLELLTQPSGFGLIRLEGQRLVQRVDLLPLTSASPQHKLCGLCLLPVAWRCDIRDLVTLDAPARLTPWARRRRRHMELPDYGSRPLPGSSNDTANLISRNGFLLQVSPFSLRPASTWQSHPL